MVFASTLTERFATETLSQKQFCGLGASAGAPVPVVAADEDSRLESNLGELNTLATAHRHDTCLAAMEPATMFGRRRGADLRSILPAGSTRNPTTHPVRNPLAVELPTTAARSLSDNAPATNAAQLS